MRNTFLLCCLVGAGCVTRYPETVTDTATPMAQVGQEVASTSSGTCPGTIVLMVAIVAAAFMLQGIVNILNRLYSQPKEKGKK